MGRLWPFTLCVALFMVLRTWISAGTDCIGSGVLADLDPRSKSASRYGPPGQNPLADVDPLSRIWSPLQKRYHSAKKRMSHTLDD